MFFVGQYLYQTFFRSFPASRKRSENRVKDSCIAFGAIRTNSKVFDFLRPVETQLEWIVIRSDFRRLRAYRLCRDKLLDRWNITCIVTSWFSKRNL